VKTNVVVGVVAAVFVGCVGAAVIRAQQEAQAPAVLSKSGPSRPGPSKPDPDEARIRAGFNFAFDQGLRLNLRGKDLDSVGLGSYLVNAAGGCNDCHTAPPYTLDPHESLHAPKQINVACYLAGGSPFGPGLVSRNLTPGKRGRPAGLTFEQFKRVIRTGEDPDEPGRVLQVMPWPVYQSLTDRDLRAIYDFLSSIPEIPDNACGVPSES
jgi:hypothetical protein